jgi:hypothetical protein
LNRRSTASCRRRRSGEWKAGFGSFWPKGNHFLGTVGAIVPGEVAPIAVAAAHGVQLATGVLVLYADDLSFTFMTPQGHMFGGWITFSASQGASGTELDIAILMRAGDPLYEIAMPIRMRKEGPGLVGCPRQSESAPRCNIRQRPRGDDGGRLAPAVAELGQRLAQRGHSKRALDGRNARASRSDAGAVAAVRVIRRARRAPSSAS